MNRKNCYSGLFTKSKLLLLLIGCLATTASFAQNTGSLSGYVTDGKTEEPIVGAAVLLEGTQLGAVTDIDGFYQIQNIPAKTYNVSCSFVGYEKEVRYNIVIRSGGNPDLNFQINESATELEGVEVVANPFDRSPETPLSIQTLSQEEVATYPGGNNDIAKVVQSLPGVSGSIGGFRNDVIIRGGAPNENVYYLDGVEIPNINHFATQGSAGGPVGLLNVSFFEGVSLASSAFHARYDNPLSGVLQFDQRDGNTRRFQTNFRLSASEAALTFEGPLFKKGKESSKTSFIASVRRSYLQFLFELIGLPIRPDYWDFQYKITHRPDAYNEINIIGLGSIDDFSLKAPDDFDESQQATLEQVPIITQRTNTTGVTWKKRFKDDSGYMLTALSTNLLSNNLKQYEDNENETGLYFQNDSRETEYKLRYEQTRFVGEWTVTGGFTVQHADYFNNSLNLTNNFSYEVDYNLWKYGLFGQFTRSFADNRLDFSAGFRMDANSFTTQQNQLLETFAPRASLSYVLDEARKWRANASIGRYFKLPPYTILGFQNNMGQFANQDANYIRSDHAVLGIEYLLTPSSRISVEGFYKWYSDYPVSLIDSVSLANKGGGFEVLGNEPITSIGKGRAYGLEFLFQQKFTKNFYAILAYTLYKSEFSAFDSDNFLPSVWDNRHLITFTGGYKFGNNWELGLRYRFLGSTPYPLVDEEATLAVYPDFVLNFQRLGEERLDPFSAADVRIDKKWNLKGFTLDLFLEVQNVLNSDIPNPPEYGLARTEEGVIIDPRQLALINDVDNSQAIPTIGIVIDF